MNLVNSNSSDICLVSQQQQQQQQYIINTACMAHICVLTTHNACYTEVHAIHMVVVKAALQIV